jgi:peptide/nickel transport system permease protein
MSAPSGVVGLAFLIVVLVVSFAAPPILADYARAFDVSARYQGSGAEHLLGTDALGRDILARLLVATRLSIGVATVAALVGAVIGILLGAGAVLLPPRLRSIALRAIDTMIAFPFILLTMFVSTIAGFGVIGTVVAIAIPASFGKARVTSALAMSIGGREFIAAARVLGVGRGRLLLRYVLPNIAETLLITTTVSISTAIIALSSLSFLGLGIQPPEYDWGRMLTEGVNTFYLTPAAAVAPAVAIAISALTFGFIGEALARAFNPVLWTVGSVGTADQTLPDLQDGRDATRRSLQVKSEAHPKLSNANGSDILQVQDLRVQFPGATGPVPVVDGVSFSVHEGEMLGIVGESGSGKSMTMMAIAQLVPYPGTVHGTVKVRGGDLRTVTSNQLARILGSNLAVVFQDPMSSLNPALRVGVQLSEGAQVHRKLSRAAAKAEAIDRLGEVGIPIPERQIERWPHELSGGMRQRVMIAMGLMNEPTLLIADEPTTSLDVTIQAQIMEVLDQINASRKTAVILISHNIGLISQNCQRVLVMYAGRIVEDLSVQQLINAPMHPYTRALLAAVPDVGRDRSVPLEFIAGQPPDPAALPTGCPYHPRCPFAIAKCAVERPALTPRADGGSVACWVASGDLD